MIETGYTAQQLVEKAEELLERCEFELALQFLARAVEVENENVDALIAYAEVLVDQGKDLGLAEEMLRKSLQIAPGYSPEAWLQLGQLCGGEESLQCIERGAQLFEQVLNMETDPAMQEEIRWKIASAWCSMIEVYLTDLQETPEVVSKCIQIVEKALQTAPSNPEVHQVACNVFLTAERQDEAKHELDQCLQLLSLDPERELTSYQARREIAKLCFELQAYDEAVDLFEELLEEDDRLPEVWYLVGLCYIAVDEKETAVKYFEQAQNLLQNDQDPDPELLEAVKEALSPNETPQDDAMCIDEHQQAA